MLPLLAGWKSRNLGGESMIDSGTVLGRTVPPGVKVVLRVTGLVEAVVPRRTIFPLLLGGVGSGLAAGAPDVSVDVVEWPCALRAFLRLLPPPKAEQTRCKKTATARLLGRSFLL